MADNLEALTKRYGGVSLEALTSVLSPALIPLHSLDLTIRRLPGQSHYRASFSIAVTDEINTLIVPGRTGKFVPASYVDGGSWREIAKGRILAIDLEANLAHGEVYTGGNRATLVDALSQLTPKDYLEIDQYGASAKVLSALVEFSLVRIATKAGYRVTRMPEDVARHVGSYYYYDFRFEKAGVSKRVEVKSLWGTDTRYARLIHSLAKDFPTSSCRFADQDIFAVSLFLRTGNLDDFAFARSIPRSDATPYGLPRSSLHQDHVHQNPTCNVGDGTWFGSIDEVWSLP